MSKSLQTHDMSEFIALAEHYRTLLQETERSAALLRRVEQGREQWRNVAPDKLDKAEGRRAAYEKEYTETGAVARHARRAGIVGGLNRSTQRSASR